jgi:putative PEP-CTERM system histidine kinase
VSSLIAFTAALLSALLALVAIVRRRSFASWTFAGGMLVLACVSLFEGLSINAKEDYQVVFWLALSLGGKALIPPLWIAFSLAYSRGNYREFLARWRGILILSILLVVPVVLFRNDLLQIVAGHADGTRVVVFSPAGKGVNAWMVISCVLILTNLERTLRAAVGTMRWRIKFVVLGLGLVFSAWIYTHTEALLFSVRDPNLTAIETAAVLIGAIVLAGGYIRGGFAEVDVYPSKAILQGSLIVLLAGIYLFSVGVLAQLVSYFGGVGSFHTQVLMVLAAVVVLAIAAFSERMRESVQHFIARHFQRPRHDYRKVWTELTRQMSKILGETEYCGAAANFLSRTFRALSVSVWLVDGRREKLVLSGSTLGALPPPDAEMELPLSASEADQLNELAETNDLEKVNQPWAASLCKQGHSLFRRGGQPLCVSLISGEVPVGVVVLADRVNGVPYGIDERDLLKCIADQLAAGLLNLRLSRDLMQAKELEAFQTMSTFLVHDLKNAASSLGLTLQNLPLHYDNPEFRKDALRALGTSVDRINHFIHRLTTIRGRLDLKREEVSLAALVESAIADSGSMPGITIVKELGEVPAVRVDREHMSSVLTNLLLNARDAIGGEGEIRITIRRIDSRASLEVADNGCGMSPQFVRDSLFRPFQTTKKQGLGIGMFQSKMIVEAHGGSMLVQSTPAQGTSFIVTLPLHPRDR